MSVARYLRMKSSISPPQCSQADAHAPVCAHLDARGGKLGTDAARSRSSRRHAGPPRVAGGIARLVSRTTEMLQVLCTWASGRGLYFPNGSNRRVHIANCQRRPLPVAADAMRHVRLLQAGDVFRCKSDRKSPTASSICASSSRQQLAPRPVFSAPATPARSARAARALTNSSVKAASRTFQAAFTHTFQAAFQYTPVLSSATCVTPSDVSRSANSSKSAAIVLKVRTSFLMRLLARSRHNDTGQHRLLVDVEPTAAFVNHLHGAPPASQWSERGVPFSQTLLRVLPVVQEQHSVVPREHPRQVFAGSQHQRTSTFLRTGHGPQRNSPKSLLCIPC